MRAADCLSIAHIHHSCRTARNELYFAGAASSVLLDRVVSRSSWLTCLTWRASGTCKESHPLVLRLLSSGYHRARRHRLSSSLTGKQIWFRHLAPPSPSVCMFPVSVIYCLMLQTVGSDTSGHSPDSMPELRKQLDQHRRLSKPDGIPHLDLVGNTHCVLFVYFAFFAVLSCIFQHFQLDSPQPW